MYNINFLDEDGDDVYSGSNKFTKEDTIILLNSNNITINNKMKRVLNVIPEIGLYENSMSTIKHIDIIIEDV